MLAKPFMSILSRAYDILRANFHYASPFSRKEKGKETDHFSNPEKETDSSHAPHSNQRDPIDERIAQYYKSLEIPYDSDKETIRKAWKQLLKKYHPDKHSTDPEKREIAHQLTQELNRAYRELEIYLKNKS